MKALAPKHLLRNARDLQSLGYLVGAPALAVWLWTQGWNGGLYGLMLVLWIGVGVIHHHHAHLPMWHHRWLNRATDMWMAALQGHPTYAFTATHNANHHRHRQGPGDWARTYRFGGGDTNHLLGYLLHPLQAACVLYPHFWAHLRGAKARRSGLWRWAMVQYVLVFAVWGVALALHPANALLYLLLPQVLAMHWLLGANYLQHAHADGHSRWNYARNFLGAVNTVYFNIGFHTAHHEFSRAHWSRMPQLHATLAHQVDARLIEASLLRYMARVMLLGMVWRGLRSQSLMAVLPHIAPTSAPGAPSGASS